MADCKFLSGNALVSGTLKREVFYVDGVKHIKRLEARVTKSGKQKIYIRLDVPSKRKPSSNMTMARSRFTMASRIFKNMPHEEKMKYHKEWKAAKYKFNGKEYATLRGYVIARLYAVKVV
jgi:hypothetical protein